ncbi:hypothetical protein J2S05_001823 [Alkalicoccobacillus murimartini]|uniref:Uncharacterized protein n=1 Tax=Alkalicoccobacillus murimartini TaxID=171685 RepID=A0ABT9YH49_9BACI|nr:hypothetical protein [Alkalicoccobacillus murimartini]
MLTPRGTRKASREIENDQEQQYISKSNEHYQEHFS